MRARGAIDVFLPLHALGISMFSPLCAAWEFEWSPCHLRVWVFYATASPARPLPVPAGAEALAAAVGVLGGPAPRRVAALLLDSLPGTAALLEDGPDGWMPLGQVHLAPEHRHGLAFSGEELVAVSRGGEVIRKHVRDGSLITHPAPGGPRGREYHAAGALPGGGLLRLALRPRGAGAGAAWSAELLEGGVGA
ncbi:unnamed protein product [Prorocentrum cordatum]|uniref:Anaphase-promoting complex subunit 1 n=1 Tax=Prorocentrum cordatum TaxID=2364126 RepID=A0ABN9TXL5_9DINO|nr:unnamed protein product [Polarella glacialis]